MNDILNAIGILSNIFGVASVFFAAAAYWQARRTRQDLARERQRLAEKIEVVLALEHANGRPSHFGSSRRELPVSLTRAELTRAELLGRLGMMPMREPGRRFSLTYLGTPSFLKQLAVAQAARGETEIVIPCSDVEFEQFA